MFAEMSDMHLTYGATDGNGKEAMRLCTGKFLRSQQLHHSAFAATEW
jgi:hypothetical protein